MTWLWSQWTGCYICFLLWSELPYQHSLLPYQHYTLPSILRLIESPWISKMGCLVCYPCIFRAIISSWLKQLDEWFLYVHWSIMLQEHAIFIYTRPGTRSILTSPLAAPKNRSLLFHSSLNATPCWIIPPILSIFLQVWQLSMCMNESKVELQAFKNYANGHLTLWVPYCIFSSFLLAVFDSHRLIYCMVI